MLEPEIPALTHKSDIGLGCEPAVCRRVFLSVGVGLNFFYERGSFW